MLHPDQSAAVAPVLAALDRLHVRYYIGGSLASCACGLARSTVDADLVAELTPERATAFAKLLGSDYYVERKAIMEAIARTRCFNVIHLPTMFKVDIFIPKQRAYDQSAMDRRRADHLGPSEGPPNAFFASPEDVILSKLEWFRLGNEVSERQLRDVVGVMQVQGSLLDIAYIERWAGELRLTDLWRRACEEARQ